MKRSYWFVIFCGFFFISSNCLNATEKFNSQASQDEFVYTLLYDVLNKKDQGYYLDIGASHPTYTNNSFFFESQLKWNGVSIDISPAYQELWNRIRKNALIIADALNVDYREMLKNAPYEIDYLSIDVDRDYEVILNLLPFDEHIFKVITIEHDSYLYGDIYKERERKILSSLGYYLLCPDVSLDWNHNSQVQQCSFEDWWVHPSILKEGLLNTFQSCDLTRNDHAEIVRKLRIIKAL
ncbi:MAG TPA: hypothetical protein VLE96_02305 [Chlamydiales bacterium]|nr:hypothetical protein [Chlamydiales bacterium]